MSALIWSQLSAAVMMFLFLLDNLEVSLTLPETRVESMAAFIDQSP